jgi:hypothetical protein
MRSPQHKVDLPPAHNMICTWTPHFHPTYLNPNDGGRLCLQNGNTAHVHTVSSPLNNTLINSESLFNLKNQMKVCVVKYCNLPQHFPALLKSGIGEEILEFQIAQITLNIIFNLTNFKICFTCNTTTCLKLPV